MNLEQSYAVYLAVSVAMTVWVARTLSRSGEVFLVKCFGQDEELARSTNHLLVVGFYLINLGFIALRLGGWASEPPVNLLPYVGSKIGVTLLMLGAMHFFNMAMIARYGRTVSGWVRSNEAARGAAAVPPPIPH